MITERIHSGTREYLDQTKPRREAITDTIRRSFKLCQSAITPKTFCHYSTEIFQCILSFPY